MKIGINVSFLAKPMTGIGQVTKEFLKTLSQHPEFEKHQWYFYTDGPLAPTEKPLFSPINCTWREVNTWWSRQDIPHQYFFERWSLPRAVAQDTLDVFFSLYQSATVLPKPVRHVMLVHDIIPKLFPEYLAKWTTQFHYHSVLRAITQATALITPSETTRQDIVRELHLGPERIQAIPIGVGKRFFEHLDPDMLTKRLAVYQLKPGYWYHGGGLEIRKNTKALLEAYADLVKARGDAVPPLVISGKIHAESNVLATPVKTIVATIGLTKRVRLLGLVPEHDLPILYQGAQAFVFPSLYEGFGLPILEAWASGTPVIMSDGGSLKELISSDNQALIVPTTASCTQALKDQLIVLLDQPHLRNVLREQGQARARQYTWELFTEKTLYTLIQ